MHQFYRLFPEAGIALRHGAHSDNEAITKVTFGKLITSIGASAFEGCKNLAAVDFSKATALTNIGDQALAGTAIVGLDLTKTQVTEIPANLIRVRDLNATPKVYGKNETLKSVAFSKKVTDLKTAFSFCTKLETITLDSLVADGVTLNAYELDSCLALEKVVIPGNISEVPEGLCRNCKALAFVTFAHKAAVTADAANGIEAQEADALTSIGTKAFDGTAIAVITIPAWTTPTIEASAFANCTSLKTVNYLADVDVAPGNAPINNGAFLGDNDYITINTSQAIVTLYTTNNVVSAPLHAKFVVTDEATDDEDETPVAATELEGTVYKSNDKKFYAKFQVPATGGTDWKIDEKYGRVYASYLDADLYTLNMVEFKKKGGYYTVAAGDVALILTDSATVKYTPVATTQNSQGTSWVKITSSQGAVDAVNQLHLVGTGTTKADLEGSLIQLDGEQNAIYVWINNATKGVGFQKLGNISSIPAGTLYVFAKEPAAAGARLNVVWRDENGNIIDETTAIQSLESEKANDGAIYNLQGVRVNAAKKGLYIQNGKKYIVK